MGMKTKMKIIIYITLSVLLILVGAFGTRLLASATSDDEEIKVEKTYQLSPDAEEDINVSKLMLDEVNKSVNITSYEKTASYIYQTQKPELDGNWMENLIEKGVHKTMGKDLTLWVKVKYDYRADLLDVAYEDVYFDKKSGLLMVSIPEPSLNVRLDFGNNDEKSDRGLSAKEYTKESGSSVTAVARDENGEDVTEMKKEANIGLLASDYTDEEDMRHLKRAEAFAKDQVEEDASNLENAKKEIEEGLEGFLNSIKVDQIQKVDVIYKKTDE